MLCKGGRQDLRTHTPSITRLHRSVEPRRIRNTSGWFKCARLGEGHRLAVYLQMKSVSPLRVQHSTHVVRGR